MSRPTRTQDGVRLRIAASNCRGDTLRDEHGRAWLWEGNDSAFHLRRIRGSDEPYVREPRHCGVPLDWYLQQLGDA